jgi:HAD superfamily hydrolase (TIGR01509 family)
MIKAVLFDMDGVLADTEPLHEQATREVLKQHGISLSSEEYANCMGTGAENTFRSILAAHNLTGIDIAKLVGEKAKIYIELSKNVKEVPGAKELVSTISGKMKIGVVSSSSRDKVITMLKKLHLRPYFEVIIAREDVAMAKPHPEPYMCAAERFKIKPDTCVAIEDAYNGLLSAKAAGMNCIVLRTSNARYVDFSKADLIVSNLGEVTLETVKRLGESPK